MTTLDPDYFDTFNDAFSNPNGDGTHTAIELINWDTIHDHGDEIVPGLIIPGRWTSLAAAAKAGKTTLEMFITLQISLGHDPFDNNLITPQHVLYIDAEMGRLDLEERLHELGHHHPNQLDHWHATDMPPRLDTTEGGNALQHTATTLGATVIVIDGINGTVTGAEKDDTTWRAFYDHTIFPLKRLGIAIITGDNLGKDETLGPRGSSVKLDKPDAVIRLKRTDNGVKLTTTHRRTSAYPLELLLSIDGLDGDQPITYRRTNTAWPSGTEQTADLLDELGVPVNDGRGKARQALIDAGRRAANEVLTAAIRYRKLHPRIVTFELDNDLSGPVQSHGQVHGQVKTPSRTGSTDSLDTPTSTRADRSHGQVRTGPGVERTVGGCSETDTPNVQTAETDHTERSTPDTDTNPEAWKDI